MNVTSLNKIGSKGLYSPKMFNGIIPKGKAGKTFVTDSNMGKLTYRLGARISTNEILTAVTIVSNMLSDMDLDYYKEDINRMKVFEDKPNLVGNPVLRYTEIVFNLGDLAVQMNMKRNKSSRVKHWFENLEMLFAVYENPPGLFNPKKQIIDVHHFRDFSLNKGMAQISVSNQMLQVIIPLARGIRLDKVLMYRGTITAELALGIEHEQWRKGKQSLPQQTYTLKFLADATGLTDMLSIKRQHVIDQIQLMLDEMFETDKDFPKYIYDDNKEFFYNKYKKGAEQNLFTKTKKDKR